MKTEKHKGVKDPFQCSCSMCISFWKNVFGNAASGILDSQERRQRESSHLGIRINELLRIGDRVSVLEKKGVVKYVGFLDDNHVSPNVYVGVKLDENVNSLTNGLFEGKRYFHCTPGHGIMVPYSEVKRLRQFTKVPNLTNPMFPSWEQVKRGRKHRQERLDEFYRSRSCSPRSRAARNSHVDYNLYSNRSTEAPPRFTTDKNDIVFKERLKAKNPVDDSDVTEKRKKDEMEKRNFQIRKKYFGNGERADKLAETLKYLQQGYQKGEQEKLRSQRHHITYDTD